MRLSILTLIILVAFNLSSNSIYAVVGSAAATTSYPSKTIEVVSNHVHVEQKVKSKKKKSGLFSKIALKIAAKKIANLQEEGTTSKTNGMALASLICGLVGIFVAGIILGILAVIFGGIALRKIREAGGEFSGKGLAIAGVILGIIATFGAILFLLA